MSLRDVPVLADASLQPPESFIRPRKIQILVLHQNRQPYSNTEVNVVPSSAPLDHTFRFYEPPNSHVTLQVPPFLSFDYSGMHAVLSRP